MCASLTCKTLLGTKGLDFSIRCLKSFLEYSKQKIHLQIFEDGTLTANNKEKILSALPNSIIVDKIKRNEIIKKKLAKYPQCLHYRNSTNFAQKLFDIMLYEDEDTFFIDSDIIFIKKFNLPQFGVEPVFMADSHNAYTFTPYEIFRVKYPVFPFINSGILYFPRNLFDLNFIETLLSDKVIKQSLINKTQWSEQTIWSLLAAKANNVCYFDYDQVVMAQEVIQKQKIKDDIIAVHCVSSLRDTAFEVVKDVIPVVDDLYHTINLIKIQDSLSKIAYAIEKYRIALKRKTTTDYFKQNIFKVTRPKNKVYRNL